MSLRNKYIISITGLLFHRCKPGIRVNLDITRAEFAAVACGALGLKASGAANKFSDVHESDWFCGAVRAACEYVIVSGYGDGTFKPGQAITREEAMAIITHA